MKKEKSKIILEDYENEFSFKKNKSNISINFNRVAFIFFVFLIISIIYTIQLFNLGNKTDIKKDLSSQFNKKLHRADLVEINGNYLAKTVSSINVGINPSEVIDKKKLLINLKLIFPNKNFEIIKKKLNKNKFFYIEKKISQENYEKIMLLGDKSIKSEERLIRIYPQKNLFSHVIGQIDDDNNGISGLEKTLDQRLKKTSYPIQLTLDADIQFLIKNELVKFNSVFQTKGSSAILMNVNNGEILSLVSLPDFDLNMRKKITDTNYINRATKAVYELGSVFKTFTIAAALNENLITVDTNFLNLKKQITCGKNVIREYDNEIPSNLTVEQILIRSGNIGSVRIGQKLGTDKLKSFLTKIGVLTKIDFDIEEVGSPIKFRWGKCKLATASFGHGITTTPLQIAKGYAIISNGGFEIRPTLLKKKDANIKKRIMREGVSEKINLILRKIVTTKQGTANFANVEGYEVGGKTGTAQKTKLGEYSKEKVNTFAAIFPTSKPKYVLVVVLDEPKLSKDYIYHYRDGSGIKYKGTPFNTAGWTTVEATGKILEKIGPILATKYIQTK